MRFWVSGFGGAQKKIKYPGFVIFNFRNVAVGIFESRYWALLIDSKRKIKFFLQKIVYLFRQVTGLGMG